MYGSLLFYFEILGSKDIMEEMNDDFRWRLILIKKFEIGASDAFMFFRNNGIEPILIKGWAAARNYPDNILRFYSDIDLAVSDADFPSARTLLRSKSASNVNVDLHHELRHLDTRLWIDIFRDSQEFELNGVSVRVPSDEDHLRIMAVHWLTDGGARKERLWDIYHAVQNRPAKFDWDRCLGSVSEVRRGWIIATIGLAHKYLGLDIKGLPFELQATNLPVWLIKTVEREWKSGLPLRSLHIHLNSPRALLKQIGKRFPPNPIQATIEMEGAIDNGFRIGYQIRSMGKRTIPSLRGVMATLKNRIESRS